MQISSISTTQLLPVANSTASGQSFSQSDYVGSYAESSDGAVLNNSADSFSSLVQTANAMPEIRSEVVDAYKARIRTGHYPSEDIVAGLTRLVGGAIAQQLKTESSSKS
jgi:hypothetical protein